MYNILFRPFSHADAVCTWYLLTQYGVVVAAAAVVFYGILNTDVFAHESLSVFAPILYICVCVCMNRTVFTLFILKMPC